MKVIYRRLLQGVTIAFTLLPNNPGAGSLRDVRRSIVAAIVHYQHFT